MMKIYAKLLILFYFCLLTGILFPAIILWHAGETWTVDGIIRHQKKYNSLWSHGLIDKELDYKKRLYLTTQPEIIVLGSSRTLQFREFSFSRPFVNMGRGLRLADLANESAFLTQNLNLKVVLYGLDYWNFSKQFCTDSTAYRAKEQSIGMNTESISQFSNIIPREVLDVWPMIKDGQIILPRFLKTLPDFINGFENRKKLGLRGFYTNKGGYLRDGSNLDLEALTNPSGAAQLFETEMARIRTTKEPYQLPQKETPCTDHTADILKLKENLEKSGVELIIFIPPLPAEHAQILRETPHSATIYQTMIKELADHHIKAENYFEQGDFQNGEFLDSFHPGEAVSLKILRDLSGKYPVLIPHVHETFW